jgi:LacI family transcriptional regulator
MVSDEMTEVNGYRAASAMLRLPAPPTAFLASSIISGLGVRRAIEEAGLVAGRDVSLIIHDDMLSYLSNSGDVPQFTATRSSVREAGRQLARMLIERIADPDAAPRHVLLEAELTVGRSTGPAPEQRQSA